MQHQHQHQHQQQPPPPPQFPFISVDRRDLLELETRMAAIPGMKFSYEINSYKKVSGNYFYVIPKGKKCIVWFTRYKMKPTAIFFELDPRDHSKIKFISVRDPHPLSLNYELCAGDYGTACYGTLFAHKTHQFFTVENIHSYKNASVDALSVDEKQSLIDKLFQEDGLGRGTCADETSETESRARVWFGLPIKHATYADALRSATNDVSYDVYAIQGRFGAQADNNYHQNCQNSKPRATHPIQQQQQQQQSIAISTAATAHHVQLRPTDANANINHRVFIARAENYADVYSLYCPETGNAEPDYAHVGSYKTSVFMNSVFRRVRENDRLDTIEESDDETEFQNNEPNKHVNTEKVARILCSFNHRFKRWVPIKMAN